MSENSPNKADFYGRDFTVTSDVLIPRPETEMMIDMVLNIVGESYLPGVKPGKAKLPRSITIMDVGTGSGCIAVTLKLKIPEARIVAVDVSEKALKVARENAERFNANVEFVKSNLLSEVGIIPDLVVANLPYVDENWEWIDKKALSAEPREALYADNHGLELILKLINQVCAKDIHHLVLEADPCQHDEIISYASKKGLKLVETRGFAIYLFSE